MGKLIHATLRFAAHTSESRVLALKQHLIAKTLKAQEADGYTGIMRTWAPRGQTPVFQETFNWKSLSIIGGLARWRFYLPRVKKEKKQLRTKSATTRERRRTTRPLLANNNLRVNPMRQTEIDKKPGGY